MFREVVRFCMNAVGLREPRKISRSRFLAQIIDSTALPKNTRLITGEANIF